MPTLLIVLGYRFFFYSNENNEPVHVHVVKAEHSAKVWLDPIEIAYMNGFSSKEENEIMRIVAENFKMFRTKWYEYFG
jgi:hypothetical protein